MLFEEVVGHDELVQNLVNNVRSDKVSHAQLFAGPEGAGKLQLAIAFAQYLLCDNRSEKDSCGSCPACKQVQHLTHPDLHFAFPVVLSKTNHVQSSDDRLTEWKDLLLRKKYFNLSQWQGELGELGKNAVIGKEESQHIQRKLSLTSYSGKYKIMVIWLAEMMNASAANKLLKLLEEPPDRTIFLLTSTNTDNILPTIISRTQIIRVPGLTDSNIASFLVKNYGVDESVAGTIASLAQGNISQAVGMVEGDQSYNLYFDLFVRLMRAAYAANPNDLMDVSDEIALLEKEQQKSLILYGLRIFRESMLLNYMKGQLNNLRPEEQQFLSRFARFINNQNITELHDEFNTAHYHLERNANSRILFTDLVVRLTKLIKKGV